MFQSPVLARWLLAIEAYLIRDIFSVNFVIYIECWNGGSQNNFLLGFAIWRWRFSPKFSILIGLENRHLEIVNPRSSTRDSKNHSRGDHFLGLTISGWRFCKLATIITKKHKITHKKKKWWKCKSEVRMYWATTHESTRTCSPTRVWIISTNWNRNDHGAHG